MAYLPGCAALIQKIRGGVRITRQQRLGCQQLRQSGTDLKTDFGQFNCRCEQRRPGQLAVAPVRQFEHAHNAGYANRAAAGDGVEKTERLAVAAVKKMLVDRGRCGFATIKRFNGSAVEMQQEGSAADAG